MLLRVLIILDHSIKAVRREKRNGSQAATATFPLTLNKILSFAAADALEFILFVVKIYYCISVIVSHLIRLLLL